MLRTEPKLLSAKGRAQEHSAKRSEKGAVSSWQYAAKPWSDVCLLPAPCPTAYSRCSVLSPRYSALIRRKGIFSRVLRLCGEISESLSFSTALGYCENSRGSQVAKDGKVATKVSPTIWMRTKGMIPR